MLLKNQYFLVQALVIIFSQSLASQSWFTTYQSADLMVSGVNFNNTGGALKFNHPNGLASNGTNLLVCDRFNNRVLIWKNAPMTWNMPPDLVLGQQNFLTNNPGISKSEMNWPGNASVSKNGKLAIADTDNDRLLLWNNFPLTNGQPADVSIYLPAISPVNIQLIWSWPWGIWTDGTRLAAVATMGGTILFWNSFPSSDNQQPDYTITNPNFGTPRNISTDGSTFFFVGDHNAKVNGIPGTYFWNSYPTSNNQSYDFYRNDWIKGNKLSNGKLIASGLNSIYTWNSVPVNASQGPDFTASPQFYFNGDGVDVTEASGRIYICNYNGNNILVYSTPLTNTLDPVFALGASSFEYNTLDSIGYIQNPSFSSDGTKLIITSDFNKRIYIYNKFPTMPGQLADAVISTTGYDLAPWDNALHNNKFVAVGRNLICVWNNTSNLSQNPSVIFKGNIGTAIFNDLKGVAIDNQFFYVADRNGKVYIWNGIPSSNSVNPAYTLDLGNVELNRLSSDGTYLCVTQQSPAAIHIYKVSSILSGNIVPWKTISGHGFLNLPSEAITFNGSLAIANTSFHDVLLWKDINNAPDAGNMIILGQTKNSSDNVPSIGQKGLFMPGALLFSNNTLWVGEHKFSSRILEFSFLKDSSENLNNSTNLMTYPNPANQIINIECSVILKGKTNLDIINNSGQKVFQQTFYDLSSTSVNISELSTGIYYLHFSSNGNSTLTKKIVKIK